MPILHEKAVARGKLGGRPRGKLSLVRELEKKNKQALEKIIYRKTKLLTFAGMSLALGQLFCYQISLGEDGKKKHTLIDDPKQIEIALDSIARDGISEDGNFYYVTTKEPDVRAIEMLLNRAYGKPKESIKVEGEVKFSLKALADQRKTLDVKATVVPVDPEILLPNNQDDDNQSAESEKEVS